MGKIISTFTKSKVASDSVKTGTTGKIGLTKHGSNTNQTNVSFKSNTKAAVNPTTK